eukprot:CAMPEP_0115460056 /NCGR_PEP_ID=MMETSP0271-20121206/46579_1 /TAXON_ID=71861 /ORGANISM="Scrippsiella trochoidea, Strain CCMP3099" /LENGTH=41 /DNA_ID= /DNA_START= /DNA_END= /DNA_ORIENTATION=
MRVDLDCFSSSQPVLIIAAANRNLMTLDKGCTMPAGQLQLA